MKTVQRLWQAIETVPGPTAVLAKWKELLGAEYQFAEPYLRPTMHLAGSYPRPEGEIYTPPYKVVEHGPGSYMGVCPVGGDAITLTKQDLVIYELDLGKLHRAIAEAMVVDAGVSAVDGAPSTHRIATFRPYAGYSFPVYLTIPPESSAMTQAVHVVRSLAGSAFLLVAPTNRRLRPEAEALLREAKATFLPLSEAIGLNGQDKMNATSMAVEALDAFSAAQLPAAEDSDGVVFFATPNNARWSDLSIRFVDGHTVAVSVGEVSRTLHYAQMGMANKKNAKPTVQWELLHSFSKGYGNLTWDHSDASRKNQKRRENLTRDLTRFFRIEGDPIAYDKDGKGWRTLFTVEPDV